jgi:peptidoglycan/LPS O-acetylase OafA/YrhL
MLNTRSEVLNPKTLRAVPNYSEQRLAPQPQQRIPELDGLRGVAIAMVIIVHYFSAPIPASAPPLLRMAQTATALCWSGVDLFFVLSGYLIGGILLEARESPNYFKVFYIRRICRIFPIYFLFCGACAFLFRFFPPVKFPQFSQLFVPSAPWYAYASFTQNIWMSVRGLWGPALLVVTWSLAVEEQFYLTLPAIVRFVRKSALPYFLMAGVILAPVVRTVLLIADPRNRMGLYVLLPCRMDSLLLGVLAAWALRKPEVSDFLIGRRRLIWKIFAFLAVGVLCFVPRPYIFWIPMVTLGYDLLALFFVTALVLVLLHPESWLAQAMRWRWLRALGAISYGAYLIHMAIYGLCMGFLLGRAGTLRTWVDLGVTLLALVLTLGIAQFSWRFFESPIVRRGHAMRYESLPLSSIPSSVARSQATH